MANEDAREMLAQGAEEWNRWRKTNPTLWPELSSSHLARRNLLGYDLHETFLCDADLSEANLSGVDLSGSDLTGADLGKSYLIGANLSFTDLRRANLSWAYLDHAKLQGADLGGAQLYNATLRQANLEGSNLVGAILVEANLRAARMKGADLSHAVLHNALLVEADLTDAKLIESQVYGVSAWKVATANALQRDLLITPAGEPSIHVDNLDVAQLVYVLLSNERIRGVIDTLTSKAVLILGRFTPERKPFLDGLRHALRNHDYASIVFDFDKPARRNFTETVSTLAHLSRFVIVDITDASSVPQELQRIVPDLPSVPIQPVIHAASQAYGMFGDFFDYPTVLEPKRYEGLDELLANVEQLIAPALSLAEGIERRRKSVQVSK